MKCNNFTEALAALRQHETENACHFICRRSRRSFANFEVAPKAGMRLHYDAHGIPYFHFGTQTYICHQGKDKNEKQKKKYAEKRDKNVLTDFLVKKYNVKRETKKKDCPAQIHMKHLFLLKNYQLRTFTKYEKEKTSAAIKKVLLAQEKLNGEHCITFSLPQLNEHKNHLVGKEAKFSERLDNRRKVRKKIKQFVRVKSSENENSNDCKVQDPETGSQEPLLLEDAHLEGAKQLELSHQQSKMRSPSLGKRKKKRLISNIQAKIRSVQSLLFTLPEDYLEGLDKVFDQLIEFYQGHVCTLQMNCLQKKFQHNQMNSTACQNGHLAS